MILGDFICWLVGWLVFVLRTNCLVGVLRGKLLSFTSSLGDLWSSGYTRSNNLSAKPWKPASDIELSVLMLTG